MGEYTKRGNNFPLPSHPFSLPSYFMGVRTEGQTLKMGGLKNCLKHRPSLYELAVCTEELKIEFLSGRTISDSYFYFTIPLSQTVIIT